MASIQDTIYPTIKHNLSKQNLDEFYTRKHNGLNENRGEMFSNWCCLC